MSPSFRPALLALAALSAVGLVLSFVSHIAALLGTTGPLGDHASLLHIGLFVVWLPVVLVSRRMTGSGKFDWKVVLRGCPPWMKGLVSVCAGYAALNFVVSILNPPPKGAFTGMPPSVVRGFSGHWMAFYAVGMAVLYSAAQAGETLRRCRNGHIVSFEARFCEKCGQSVDDASATASDSLKLR